MKLPHYYCRPIIDNDMKRGFGRSKQWKELLNVIKPQYYMNAKVMSKIVARKTQQEAYTRQMMLFQPMTLLIYILPTRHG